MADSKQHSDSEEELEDDPDDEPVMWDDAEKFSWLERVDVSPSCTPAGDLIGTVRFGNSGLTCAPNQDLALSEFQAPMQILRTVEQYDAHHVHQCKRACTFRGFQDHVVIFFGCWNFNTATKSSSHDSSGSGRVAGHRQRLDLKNNVICRGAYTTIFTVTMRQIEGRILCGSHQIWRIVFLGQPEHVQHSNFVDFDHNKQAMVV